MIGRILAGCFLLFALGHAIAQVGQVPGWPPIQNISAAGVTCGVVYSTSLSGDSGPEANNAFRSVSSPTTGGTGCGHVTVEFVASAAGGAMTVTKATICIQGVASACTATPTSLLVSGSSSFSVAQGTTQTSDSTAFTFTTGQTLLVSLDFGSPANARTNGSGSFYFCVSCSIAAQASPSGMTVSSGQVGYDKITAAP